MNSTIKVLAFTPKVFLGSPIKNVQVISNCLEVAQTHSAKMVLFPKDALKGASLGDLAHFSNMISYENMALNMLLEQSKNYSFGIILGKNDEVLYILGGVIQKVFKNEPVIIDGIQYMSVANPALALGFFETLHQIKEISKLYPVVYASAGYGESTTDTVPDGVSLIAQKGEILAQNQGVYGENFGKIVDFSYIEAEITPFYTPLGTPDIKDGVKELDNKAPFLPCDKSLYSEFAENIFHIQVASLVRRMEHIGAKTAVVAVSGGLDSALAILVAKKAVKLLGLPPESLIAITLPCFGTTGRTLKNAQGLMAATTPNNRTIVIKDSVLQHFNDLEHDQNDHSVVFENAQARERTQIGLDLANKYNGIFVGTGDLSELCLGFTTFSGDHMSMYGVNGGLPKTIVRFVVNHLAHTEEFSEEAPYLLDILDTPISPELLPPSDDVMSQKTESILGSYDLHDYVTYHFLNGKHTDDIVTGAISAFSDIYDEETIKKTIKTYFKRFVSQQFKRNCSPDGVSVLGLSLSPRGGLEMPSDMFSDIFDIR